MEKRSDLEPARHLEPLKKGWVEPFVALIMALATVGTAWCTYQSAAWTRHSNRASNQFNILERKVGLLNIQGMQAATIHTAMFMQVLAAQQAGNKVLADFYVQRFPPDVRKAYDAWIAQKPFENPNADPHPFVPNLYEMRGTKEIAEANTNAATQIEDARRAGTISAQYLANTVLFAAVLFFANAASKFELRWVRAVSFLFTIAVFAFAVVRIATLPR
jgi:hypothetical protein